MEILSPDLKKSDDSLILRNSLFSMDYDSGYISHNLESNLDSYVNNNGHSVSALNNRPIYLSEDALLETPEVNKYPNISLEIEKEDFEETRNVFNSPLSSVSTTEIPASAGSREMSYSGFETEESNTSIKIPYCKQLIVDNMCVQNISEYNSPDINKTKRDVYKEQHLKNLVFNNITNTLTFNDAKKKLTLIFSKDDKENVYSVKRKYPSLTPDKGSNPDNTSFFFPTPIKFGNASRIGLSGESESINDTSLSVSNSEFLELNERESFEIAQHNESKDSSNWKQSKIECLSNKDNLNCEKSEIVCLNRFSYLGKQSEVSNTENIECSNNNEVIKLNESVTEYDINNCSKLKDESISLENENYSINAESIVSKAININIFKGNIEDVSCSNEISKTIQDIENDQNVLLENGTTDEVGNSCNDEKSEDEFRGFKDRGLEPNKNIKTETLKINVEQFKHKNDISYFAITSTPEKPLKNLNEANLSPDLFTDDVIEETVQEVIPIVTITPKEKNIVKKDYMILRRTQNNLKGVIPPRSLTTIQISIPEMLKRIESNQEYFWKNPTNTKSSQNESNSMLITCPLDNCKNKEFPQVLKDRSLGLYYNRSKLSEEFEELCVKYGQRYVGTETQSSCTVFEINAISPMKKRNAKPQWNLKSPGKRLSHLARRRITFSSANLQSGSSFSAGSRARQILVDAKKMDLLSRRRSPRKSPRKTPKKTPGKSPRKKTRTPSSSAKKKLVMRFRKVTGEIEKTDTSALSAKRTLFHSPDENKKLGRLLPSTSGSLSANNEIKSSATKRALFMSPSKNSPLKSMGFKRSPVKRLDFGLEKKRKRIDSLNEPPSKFARCYSEYAPSSSESDVRTFSSRTKSDFSLLQNRQIKELTTNHKKKLQLAIYEALRSQNVLPTHPQFKVLASNLGRLTRKLFLPTTADCVGVTEKMLRIARHHVIAVVKGKSPEEIYEEYMKSKTRNVKPQGYIAPNKEKFDTEKKPIAAKPCFNSESKVDRIRKAINFGDDNT